MKFEISGDNSKLKVKLEMDGDDIDIVVTDNNGDDQVIAYLNDSGLHINPIDENVGIETEDGMIPYVIG